MATKNKLNVFGRWQISDVVVDARLLTSSYVTIEWASPAFFFFFNTGYSETRVGNGRRHATRANQ
jgi:hypothetical protein